MINYREGEKLVLEKLKRNGWKLLDIELNRDLVLQKEEKKIKIRIKVGKKLKHLSERAKNDFNYLIFTNLVDIWVVPTEMLKVCALGTKMRDMLKNKLILLEREKSGLLAEINDCGVHFHEFDNVLPFFASYNQNGGCTLKV